MKKLISATLAATLALSLAACGSSASTSEAAPAESTASSAAESAAESTAETSELAGTTLKVAASPTPHAEILNVAKEAACRSPAAALSRARQVSRYPAAERAHPALRQRYTAKNTTLREYRQAARPT